jgi:hypothetical protein
MAARIDMRIDSPLVAYMFSTAAHFEHVGAFNDRDIAYHAHAHHFLFDGEQGRRLTGKGVGNVLIARVDLRGGRDIDEARGKQVIERVLVFIYQSDAPAVVQLLELLQRGLPLILGRGCLLRRRKCDGSAHGDGEEKGGEASHRSHVGFSVPIPHCSTCKQVIY